VWWRPHPHRHQWIVPEYIRTLDSTAVVSATDAASLLTVISKTNAM
jgi:hypothetical protein